MTLRRMSRIDYHLDAMSQSAPRGTDRPLFISVYSDASDELREGMRHGHVGKATDRNSE